MSRREAKADGGIGQCCSETTSARSTHSVAVLVARVSCRDDRTRRCEVARYSPYRDYISAELIRHLEPQMMPVAEVAGLLQLGAGGGLESPESLRFLCDLYEVVRLDLAAVLKQRVVDRAFIDERTRACCGLNATLRVDYSDPAYRTVIGQEDAEGRVVIGPRNSHYCTSGGGRRLHRFRSSCREVM